MLCAIGSKGPASVVLAACSVPSVLCYQLSSTPPPLPPAPHCHFLPPPDTPQLWLVALYVIIARASPAMRIAIAATVAALSVATLPPRLWRSQLKRLAIICAVIFVFTALGADGVPPLLQARAPPPSLEGFTAGALTAEGGYSYVIAHLGIITITRRSINFAITAAALTFCALQAASLVLVTTPGEEMALALRRWLAPLRLIGVPTRRIALTLLLSLRFMSLVFEEVRNLCLGLAARGVDWRKQGGRGSLEIFARLITRLFANLFQRSENIAQAMVVRGFQGPERHNMYMKRANATTPPANFLALVALGGLIAAVYHLR